MKKTIQVIVIATFFLGSMMVQAQNKKSKPNILIIMSDDVAAIRLGDLKLTFLRQNSKGLKVWETPFEELRMPMLTNLRMDPFERAVDEASEHPKYAGNRLFYFTPAVEYVTKWVYSFKEFPPRSKPGTYGLGDLIEKMTEVQGK
jgi:arylsulfatase